MSEDALARVTGRIFEIQRFSIHDGPGIRTTVFMKGCPLRCAWCHNPEGIEKGKHLSFQPEKCIGCGYCFRVCPERAHRDTDGSHTLAREVCRVCGGCTEDCFAGALELVGKDVTVEEVLAEVLRDRPFYETSSGGMTLSGGEPMLQFDFTDALLRAAKAEQLHCCMETCGQAPTRRYDDLLPLVDLFLYDIKDTDPTKHREFTGVTNELVLANLRHLYARNAAIALRLPIVPGYNDRSDHFAGVAALVREMPGIRSVELMPYHALGTSKRARLGLGESEVTISEPVSRETVSAWLGMLRELGIEAVSDGVE